MKLDNKNSIFSALRRKRKIFMTSTTRKRRISKALTETRKE